MPTLADVFRLYGPAYLEKYRDKMSVDQCRAMRAILHCRTPELGTTVYRCKSCERLHAVHRPCGNRHCPNCQGNKAREWKRKALAQLLPCSYFMVTFTVPEALRAFIRTHPKECYRALLHSSLDALVKLAKDPKFVGFSHPRAKTDWEWLKMMVTTTLNQVYTLTVMAKPIEEPSPMLCSECGGELEFWRTVDMSIDEPMRRLLEKPNTS